MSNNLGIIDYVRSLLPSLSKNRIVDDARVAYSELSLYTVPSYIEAEKLFAAKNFRSQQMKDLSATFHRIVSGSGSQNMMVVISHGLQKMVEAGSFIQERIESTFEAEVLQGGLSGKKTNLLRILETVSFVSEYSLLLLNFAYICETGEINEDSGYVRSNLSPAEIDKVRKGMTDFALAFNAIAKARAKIEEVVDNVPDCLLDINTGDIIIKSVGEDKLDPLHLRGFSSNTNNPIYHVRLVVANWQATRYKRNQELKKVLEMRCLNMQNSLDKEPNPQLEKELDYTQRRVQQLDHQLARQEVGA